VSQTAQLWTILSVYTAIVVIVTVLTVRYFNRAGR
jgi:hypothetical protein